MKQNRRQRPKAKGQLAQMRGVSMCEKCDEIDRGIGHLRRMIEHLQDPGTLEAANKLIEEMEAKKVQLHREPEK